MLIKNNRGGFDSFIAKFDSNEFDLFNISGGGYLK
jgi:hypothetical protein